MPGKELLLGRAGIQPPMRCAAFTVDVDRDVNLPETGRRDAICQPREGDATPRFSSSTRGLELLAELLDDLGIRGTFFLEAVTAQQISKRAELRDLLARHEVASHGWSHEDLTGAYTKIEMSEEEVGETIDDAAAMIERLTGRLPRGFRAPYQHVDEAVHRVLTKRGYWYDSSLTMDIRSRRIDIYGLPNGLIECPLARGIDKRGKPIHSYLWPMHEGKRDPEDYIHLLNQYDEGLLILATHSWHVIENYGGPLGRSGTEGQMENVRAILENALDQGIKFDTLEKHVQRSAQNR